jgi:hypothetical protein
MIWAKVIQLLKNWHKYCWLVCIILLVYGLIKTFSPHIKTVETIKTVIDTESIQKAESEIIKLNGTIQTINKQMAQLKQVNKDIQSDVIIIETKYPDGRIEKRTEKRIKDTSHTTISGTTIASGTTTSTTTSIGKDTVITSSSTHTQSENTKITEKNPVPFWATSFGYQFNAQQCLLGQGINIGDSVTIGVLGSYKFNATEDDKRWDAGGITTIRY